MNKQPPVGPSAGLQAVPLMTSGEGEGAQCMALASRADLQHHPPRFMASKIPGVAQSPRDPAVMGGQGDNRSDTDHLHDIPGKRYEPQRWRSERPTLTRITAVKRYPMIFRPRLRGPQIPVPAFVNSLRGVSARIFRSEHTRRGRTGFHGRRRTSPRRAGRVSFDQPAVNRAAAMPGLTATAYPALK